MDPTVWRMCVESIPYLPHGARVTRLELVHAEDNRRVVGLMSAPPRVRTGAEALLVREVLPGVMCGKGGEVRELKVEIFEAQLEANVFNVVVRTR